MKTWVIILILLVVVFVIVPLIYFTVIVRNADKFAELNNYSDIKPQPFGGSCEQEYGQNYKSDGKGNCIKK
jgi:flagellar basal body-associated protein FliL